MDIHQNARLTPHGRAELVRRVLVMGQAPKAVAAAVGINLRRAAELPAWLHRYNGHRPHGGLQSQTTISRLGLSEDNLLSLHS